jgi:hypothetical protein
VTKLVRSVLYPGSTIAEGAVDKSVSKNVSDNDPTGLNPAALRNDLFLQLQSISPLEIMQATLGESIYGHFSTAPPQLRGTNRSSGLHDP